MAFTFNPGNEKFRSTSPPLSKRTSTHTSRRTSPHTSRPPSPPRSRASLRRVHNESSRYSIPSVRSSLGRSSLGSPTMSRNASTSTLGFMRTRSLSPIHPRLSLTPVGGNARRATLGELQSANELANLAQERAAHELAALVQERATRDFAALAQGTSPKPPISVPNLFLPPPLDEQPDSPKALLKPSASAKTLLKPSASAKTLLSNLTLTAPPTARQARLSVPPPIASTSTITNPRERARSYKNPGIMSLNNLEMTAHNLICVQPCQTFVQAAAPEVINVGGGNDATQEERIMSNTPLLDRSSHGSTSPKSDTTCSSPVKRTSRLGRSSSEDYGSDTSDDSYSGKPGSCNLTCCGLIGGVILVVVAGIMIGNLMNNRGDHSIAGLPPLPPPVHSTGPVPAGPVPAGPVPAGPVPASPANLRGEEAKQTKKSKALTEQYIQARKANDLDQLRNLCAEDASLHINLDGAGMLVSMTVKSALQFRTDRYGAKDVAEYFKAFPTEPNDIMPTPDTFQCLGNRCTVRIEVERPVVGTVTDTAILTWDTKQALMVREDLSIST